jgi:hypothetical protein
VALSLMPVALANDVVHERQEEGLRSHYTLKGWSAIYKTAKG